MALFSSGGTGGGAIFGGGARTSATTTSNTTRTNEAGFSEVGQAVSVQGDGSSLTLSDFGAINAARDIVTESLRQVELAGSNTRATVGDAVQAVSESARAETENVIIQGMKWLTILGVGIAAAWALRSLSK
jgi:hypothetical protein